MTAEGPKPRRPANRRFTSQRSRMVRGTRLGVVCRSRQAAANLTRDSNLTFNTAAGSDHDGHVMLGPGLPRLTRILSQLLGSVAAAASLSASLKVTRVAFKLPRPGRPVPAAASTQAAPQ